MPDVMIILGSKSDIDVARKCKETLDKLGISNEVTIASAHRTPEKVTEHAARDEIKVFIAIAGLSAALPGAIAAHTIKPVIGVPKSGKVNLDAILSITQMPPGVPVAAVGLDMGENAAILAAQIMGVASKEVAKRLIEHKSLMRGKIEADAESLSKEF